MPTRPDGNALSADLAASGAGGRRMARLWPQGDRTGGAHGGVRRAHGVPSPHGHDRRNETDIDRLMASTGEAAGLLFDTGHCLFAGGDPAALLDRHIARVVHVHCKDVATRRAGSRDRRGHDLHGRGAGRRIHRARRRLHRVHAAAASAARGRICRVAGGGGGAGSAQGASADLCAAWLPEPASNDGGSGARSSPKLPPSAET